MANAAAETASVQYENKAEARKAARDPRAAEHARWMTEIKKAQKVFKSWHDLCDAIVERYRDESKEKEETSLKDNSSAGRRYNSLWSVTETMRPLLYGDTPLPFIDRMFDDADPAARDASLLVQRTVANDLEHDDFDDAMEDAVEDYMLCSRGQTWVRYAPEFALRDSVDKQYLKDKEEPPLDPRTGKPYETQKDDEGTYYTKAVPFKSLDQNEVDHVGYRDFLHGAASKWKYVPWVARRVPMLHSEIESRFGKEWADILPKMSDNNKNTDAASEPDTDDFEQAFARVEIWEIWDKTKREVIWLCPAYKKAIVDKKSDPLKLPGFFPCPKPMYATKTNSTLVPVPDYKEWQDIALELDETTQRISLLTKALRVAGVYAAEYGDIIKGLTDGSCENKLIPVQNWAMFAERGGSKGMVDYFPIDQIIEVLGKLYEARRALIQELYEITGISDIVRGASDPRETATAQKVKGQFASNRLERKQKAVTVHAKGVIQIMADIVCRHYSDEQIMLKASGRQLFSDSAGKYDKARETAAFALIRSPKSRMLRLKVDNEKLAQSKVESDKQEATDFLQSMAQFMGGAMKLTGEMPNFLPLVSDLILFAVRKFKVGRTTEASFERTLKELQKNGTGKQPEQQAPGEQPMSPQELQLEQQKLQIEAQSVQIQGMLAEIKKMSEQMKDSRERERDAKAHQVKVADLQLKARKQAADIQNAQMQTQLAARSQQHDEQMGAHEAAVAEQQQRHEASLAERDAQRADRDQQHGEVMDRHSASEDSRAQRVGEAFDQMSHAFDVQKDASDRTEAAEMRRDANKNAQADRASKEKQAAKRPTNGSAR